MKYNAVYLTMTSYGKYIVLYAHIQEHDVMGREGG